LKTKGKIFRKVRHAAISREIYAARADNHLAAQNGEYPIPSVRPIAREVINGDWEKRPVTSRSDSPKKISIMAKRRRQRRFAKESEENCFDS
jgi:hypothetical protein